MIPIILICKNKKKVEEFLAGFSKEHKIANNQIFPVFPQNKEFLLKQIRSIRREVIMDLQEARLIILHDFDSATREAQNAFLKTLEEKVDKNQFILTCVNPEKILPTVRSRATIVKIDSEFTGTRIADSDKGKLEKIFSQPADFTFLAQVFEGEKTQDEIVDFITSIAIFLRARLKNGDLLCARLCQEALRTRNLISENNINARLALDNLLILIAKTYRMLLGRKS